MKIRYGRSTTISDLDIGDCFLSDNNKDCYMKIPFAYISFNDSGTIINAVNLASGELYCFESNEEVFKCDAIITIG